jgi:hypothetical protein
VAYLNLTSLNDLDVEAGLDTSFVRRRFLFKELA